MRNTLVYQSKDEEDWTKAKELLDAAHIPYHDWKSEEVSACGCGAKLDIRRVGRKGPFPTKIFHIEVTGEYGDAAKKSLAGKVKPVLSYGYGV